MRAFKVRCCRQTNREGGGAERGGCPSAFNFRPAFTEARARPVAACSVMRGQPATPPPHPFPQAPYQALYVSYLAKAGVGKDGDIVESGRGKAGKASLGEKGVPGLSAAWPGGLPGGQAAGMERAGPCPGPCRGPRSRWHGLEPRMPRAPDSSAPSPASQSAEPQRPALLRPASRADSIFRPNPANALGAQPWRNPSLLSSSGLTPFWRLNLWRDESSWLSGPPWQGQGQGCAEPSRAGDESLRNARCAERGAKCVPRGTRASACFALISEETGAALAALLAGLCTCCVAPRLGPSRAACFRAGAWPTTGQARAQPRTPSSPRRGVALRGSSSDCRHPSRCALRPRGPRPLFAIRASTPHPPRNPRRQIFIPGQTAAALSDSDGSATPKLGWVGRAWQQRARPTGRRPRSSSGTERLQSRG